MNIIKKMDDVEETLNYMTFDITRNVIKRKYT